MKSPLFPLGAALALAASPALSQEKTNNTNALAVMCPQELTPLECIEGAMEIAKERKLQVLAIQKLKNTYAYTLTDGVIALPITERDSKTFGLNLKFETEDASPKPL